MIAGAIVLAGALGALLAFTFGLILGAPVSASFTRYDLGITVGALAAAIFMYTDGLATWLAVVVLFAGSAIEKRWKRSGQDGLHWSKGKRT